MSYPFPSCWIQYCNRRRRGHFVRRRKATDFYCTAILKDAPIIIFDEATANVDPENEDKLQEAMEALMQDKTIIMIAHRLKTVRNADQILVLDSGQIVQKGNPLQN